MRMKIDKVPTPAYVVDEQALENNLRILQQVKEAAGCKILLAQKCFSMFAEYPLIGKYLDGATASGLYEARLGHEEMAGENHVFSPAYRPEEIEEIAAICDHVIFNSFSQLRRFGAKVKEIQQARGITHGIGLRINPECSTQEHVIYDPCAPGSRLGVTAEDFAQAIEAEPQLWDLLDGLHFHTLCEQNSDALAKTLQAVEQKFGCWLQKDNIHWLNMGGGHHITRADYDRQLLIDLVKEVKEKYAVEVYLEPGEAVALNAGYLVTEVLDTVTNHGVNILLLDASAACHMPDVLEMPYRPPLKDSGEAGEKAYTYKLSSCTCLAGDIIGDYSFDREILPGDRLYFEDMAIYSMVKNNTFNGMALPAIWKMDASGDCTLVKKFGYQDFKERLS
ncbi:carboxynorspermidine decarboxylase [Selenomonas ruminantium]|uniref:Carboxynorspermidine decarboxylase n=2 Tax=Selenomonas ruminantium TaxID=971 RepID=A0A1I0WS48_SELRU|nr:carboxynorspermidine decarboxylase [Selenomonas ruminantium]SFA91451.1 carboxynorspermidine decarboxylase [Selenomonas ruminantium]